MSEPKEAPARATGATAALLARRFATGACVGALAALFASLLELPVLLSWWRPYSPLVLGGALAGGLLFVTRLRGLVVGVLVLLAALWCVVSYSSLAARLAQPMVRADQIVAGAPPADAIFVFSSSLQMDGEPTTVSMSRLLRGLELLGEHRAPRLIVSELPAPMPSYAMLASHWMHEFGIAGEPLAVGPIHNTHDEGVAVAELCRKNGWRRVIAVSSPTHMRRAAAVLEHEGLEVIAVPSVETRFDLQRLDRSDDRLLAFGSAIHDLVGYQVYRLRGWIGPR